MSFPSLIAAAQGAVAYGPVVLVILIVIWRARRLRIILDLRDDD